MMTFPMFKDQSCALDKMFSKPKSSEMGGVVAAGNSRSNVESFWTNALVKAFLKRQGHADQSYDDYFRDGK